MEYEFDREQVEQIQGRLATDQVKDEVDRLQVPKDDGETEDKVQEEE